jgi:hypothetical protein
MSSSSFATLSALTVLENPRKSSPRTTVFTCHLFVGAPGLEKIQGSVRYYSEEDGEYPDVGVYHATIAVRLSIGMHVVVVIGLLLLSRSQKWRRVLTCSPKTPKSRPSSALSGILKV